jgi:hypothetical protein
MHRSPRRGSSWLALNAVLLLVLPAPLFIVVAIGVVDA